MLIFITILSPLFLVIFILKSYINYLHLKKQETHINTLIKSIVKNKGIIISDSWRAKTSPHTQATMEINNDLIDFLNELSV